MWSYNWGYRTSWLVSLPIALGVFFFLHLNNDTGKNQYDRIHKGMTQDEVEDILDELDEGTQTEGGEKVTANENGDLVIEEGEMKWENGRRSITVTFKDGKVVDKTQTGLR
jgi:hypothetical protein